jgi:uncharacterized delta-60 repeat protein
MTTISRAKQAAGVLALALSLGTPTVARAAAGDLDTTFGTGGRLTTDFARSDDHVAALLIQLDGKLVAAGRASSALSADFDFGLARYNPDGSLDVSFGVGGKLTTDFAGDLDQAAALVLQPDGKLVAAGVSGVGARQVFALARYLPDGNLDTSFGVGGKLTTDFARGDSRATALVLQPDGKLVAAGTAQGVTGHDFALVRYNTDGSLDTSFGNGGRVLTDFTGGTDEVTALVLQPDGKLVAGGSTSANATGDFALARYNPNGSLDTSFGDGGKRTTNFVDKGEGISALILQPNGKIVAAGQALPKDSFTDFALARYESDGGLDATFGTGGKVLTDFTRGTDFPLALARQADGKLVAAGGTGSVGGRFDFALARYLAEPIEQSQTPVANAGSYPPKECTADTGTLVSLDGSASHDPDGDPITYSWTGPFGSASGVNPTVALPLGASSIALTVADAVSSSATVSTQVTIVDTAAPTIAALSASPSRLGSSNHKMVPVTISVSAADACSAATTCKIVSVRSNERDDRRHDGGTAPDWRITGDLAVDLRAERSGPGSGRIYTVTVECTDTSGNKATKAVAIAVAH